MFTPFFKNALVPLLLRLALAAVFVYHGLKLVSADNEWGARWMKEASNPLPPPVQFLVAWGELIGGVALATGFLTRLAAVGLIAIMAGAVAVVHWPNGFDIRQNGFEYNLVLITMLLCLVLGGPGPFAVDHFVGTRRKKT